VFYSAHGSAQPKLSRKVGLERVADDLRAVHGALPGPRRVFQRGRVVLTGSAAEMGDQLERIEASYLFGSIA
jgi:hypothetical protein